MKVSLFKMFLRKSLKVSQCLFPHFNYFGKEWSVVVVRLDCDSVRELNKILVVLCVAVIDQSDRKRGTRPQKTNQSFINLIGCFLKSSRVSFIIFTLLVARLKS